MTHVIISISQGLYKYISLSLINIKVINTKKRAKEHFQQKFGSIELTVFFHEILVQLNVSANKNFSSKICLNGLMSLCKY